MGKRKKYDSPEKWEGHKYQYTTWWSNLTNEQQRYYKDYFLKVRDYCIKNKINYPNMWDITNIRVSKLSDKQIYRIWVFRDYQMK